ncbi:aminopeptidase P family N-terminal domain-containing protein [Vagococcus sp. BWB3-3]|uniref:Aminopeptidase P family N-terminal domain-containing protein n=1 Tax=Vagococcus allomyrinae TaxID=2794353 RepID=A0A940ST49_9ENTE|nr:aminopeptidase P family protein [Vagococcus allomyrinae]MBP1042732.1 aminopeptidase P family N-terminal domain-containing protein [Vagococcus allomyrinae]
MKVEMSLVPEPQVFSNVDQVALSDETMAKRLKKVLKGMADNQLELIVVYADKEHGANFEYLTGFIPRFEEALLVLKADGQAYLLLGNENVKMAGHARLANTVIHVPYFSLPNQPMEGERLLEEVFKEVGMAQASKVGVVGWKLFKSSLQSNQQMFDLPHYVVRALEKTVSGEGVLVNGTEVFIGEDIGARTVANSNELAHYEYGANLASTCMLETLNAVQVGKRETELGALLSAEGQIHTVVTIAATGQRFEKANLYPTHKQLQLGDKVSLTTAFKGGLSSRAGYVAKHQTDLPEGEQDYLERVVFPYTQAVVTWLETAKVGVSGGQLYDAIEGVLPKSRYGWTLNPGHFVADEEWLGSPIYPASQILLKSGMLFQVDIIPSVPGYAGASMEECVAIGDQELRDELATSYPEVWERIKIRRDYVINVLGISLSDDLLPLSNTVGYLRPYLLNKQVVTVVK